MIQFGDAAKNRIVPVGESMVQKAVDSKYLKELKTKELFSGKKGEAISSLGYFGEGIVLVGLEKTATPDEVRRAVYLGIEEIKKAKETEVLIDVALFPKNKNTFRAILEGALFSSYERIKLVKDWKPREAVKVVIANAPADAEKILEEVRHVIEGVFLARNLVNEPALTMTPARFSVKMQSKLIPLGVEVNILGRAEIAELGMSAFLSVAMGSAEEPRLVVMRYLPLGKDVAPTVLVGKGLTYDSGGYSIKPTDGMLTMHCDMGGAGSVAGTMYALAKNKVQKNVIGITALCENMISGSSYKPGDIVNSMSGKTIEITNTDAEGRVTLADTLYYASTKLGAARIVDMATLTGACIMALGYEFTGAVTNDEKLFADYKAASEQTGEKVWLLPNDPAFKEALKSEHADMVNSSRKLGAGTITAGAFLEEFVGDTPWLHLDIAGTAYLPDARGYEPKDATGVCVRTLYEMIAR